MTIKRTFLFTIIVSFALLLVNPFESSGQASHQTAGTLGLGGGGVAYQDLYHANFINPANLMLNHNRRPHITLGVVGGIQARAGGDLMNISTYNDYLTTGMTIEGTVADDMLNQWFGTNDAGMRSASMDFSLVTVGGVYRSPDWTVSIAHRIRASGKSSFSRGFADLVFRGLDSDYFNQFRAVNSSQEYYAWHEFSVGFATTIYRQDLFMGLGRNLRIYAGIAPKLLLSSDYGSLNLQSDLRIEGVSAESGGEIQHNFAYTVETIGRRAAQLEQYNQDRQAGLDPKLDDYLDPDADDFTKFRGTSLGVDIGITAQLDLHQNAFGNLGIFRGEKTLTVGLSLTDLGALSFSDHARGFDAADNFTWNGFNYDQETIDNEFDGDESAYFESVLIDSIGNDVYGNFSTRSESSHSVGLPTMIRVGSHLQLGKFGFMADIGAGIVDRGINSKRMHLSLGSEYKFFNIIPLRAGLRMGGYSSTTFHAGTGVELRNFEFTIGAAGTAVSNNKGAALGAAWSGIVVHF
ncbi:MAG: DUF5723 family protein [Rhodohalobacter sp.]|uniref:DUF5723 family protein n=1 Tax=Rhodohalobacter sp. TaxID=1974210 RepID=UPI0039768414